MVRNTLDVKELSKYIGISINTIYAMVREGEIPHKKVRSRIIFFKEVIDEWLKGK